MLDCIAAALCHGAPSAWLGLAWLWLGQHLLLVQLNYVKAVRGCCNTFYGQRLGQLKSCKCSYFGFRLIVLRLSGAIGSSFFPPPSLGYYYYHSTGSASDKKTKKKLLIFFYAHFPFLLLELNSSSSAATSSSSSF